MAAPTFTIFDVTSVTGGAAANDQIRKFNAGGAIGTAVTGVAPLDYGADEASFWAVKTFLIQAQNNTAKRLSLRLFDTAGSGAPRQTPVVTSLGEDLVPTLSNLDDASNWRFKLKLTANWTDPAVVDPATIPSWNDLAVGTNAASDLDALFASQVGTGNDGTTNLMVKHLSDATKFYSNFFLMVAVRPKTTAIAGWHEEWGFRLGYIYPGISL